MTFIPGMVYMAVIMSMYVAGKKDEIAAMSDINMPEKK